MKPVNIVITVTLGMATAAIAAVFWLGNAEQHHLLKPGLGEFLLLGSVLVRPHEFVEGIDIASAETEAHIGLQYIFKKQGRIGKDRDTFEPSTIAVANARISWILIKSD